MIVTGNDVKQMEPLSDTTEEEEEEEEGRGERGREETE